MLSTMRERRCPSRRCSQLVTLLLVAVSPRSIIWCLHVASDADRHNGGMPRTSSDDWPTRSENSIAVPWPCEKDPSIGGACAHRASSRSLRFVRS